MAISNYMNIRESISYGVRYFQIAIISLDMILLLISIFNTLTFAKINIVERNNEIAIVKSMGASNFDVVRLFLFDTNFISFLVLILSFLIQLVFWFVTPVIYGNSITYLNYHYPIILIIIVWLIYYIVYNAFVLLYFLPYAKKSPIELLKKAS